MVTRKNAFAVWLLVGITLGIYGFYLYDHLNRELSVAINGHPAPRPAWTRWWSQLIPVYGIVGIHRTAKTLNRLASKKVVSPTASWLWWGWFILGSYTYLQIGANRAERASS